MGPFVNLNQFDVRSSEKRVLNKMPVLLRNWCQGGKTHHFLISDVGLDFVLERNSDNPTESYMTANEPNLQEKDHVEIHDTHRSTTYEVLEIDFYADMPDIRIAKLALLEDQ